MSKNQNHKGFRAKKIKSSGVRLPKRDASEPNADFIYVPELSPDTEGGVGMTDFFRLFKQPCYEMQNSMTTLRLNSTSAITSTSSSTITDVFTETPVNSPQWVNLANVFDRYRVLGFQIKYVPRNKYNKAGTFTTAAVCVVTDRDDLTALTSVSDAQRYESLKEYSLDDTWKYTAVAQTSPSLYFRDALAPTNSYAIKLFASNLTSLNTYGDIFVSYLVQFQALGK